MQAFFYPLHVTSRVTSRLHTRLRTRLDGLDKSQVLGVVCKKSNFCNLPVGNDANH